jgi:hypothetical protein
MAAVAAVAELLLMQHWVLAEVVEEEMAEAVLLPQETEQPIPAAAAAVGKEMQVQVGLA